MRKLFLLLSAGFLALAMSCSAENVTLANGATFTGEIMKYDGKGIMIHLPNDTYTNVAWPKLSQDSLKQLAQNPKMAEDATPFIEPVPAAEQQQKQISLSSVSRLEMPAHPSLIAGILTSSVGWFVLLAIYVANLLAAYEVAIFRMRPPGQVIGVSAILPVIGPIIFLAMGEYVPKTEEAAPMEAVMAPSGSTENPEEQVQIVEVPHKVEEKLPDPQIFARGKFTFNKKFVETKFAGYMGELKGDALIFTMEVRTSKDQFVVERIMQISPTEVIFDTVQRGQVTALLADIQEVKLNPKPKA